MTLKPEYPRGDPKDRWLGNAETFERNRQLCQETADRHRMTGNDAGAAEFDASAKHWTTLRDAEQRREELRAANRRVHRRY